MACLLNCVWELRAALLQALKHVRFERLQGGAGRSGQFSMYACVSGFA